MAKTSSRAFWRTLERDIRNDHLVDTAAMMTYYAVFALFPMALFILMVALLVIPEDAISEGVALATRAMPEEVAAIVRSQVHSMEDAAGRGFALGSAAVTLWGASRGSLALGRALNQVFRLEEHRPWWVVQLVGIGVTLLVATLVLASLGLLVVGPAVGHFVAAHLGRDFDLAPAFDLLWSVGRWVGAAVLMMIVWGLLYRLLPDASGPVRIFTPGAVVGVLGWIGLSLLFGAYLTNLGQYQSTYGALAGIVVGLLWLWLSNLALLFGAEINHALAARRAHRAGAAASA